MYCGQGQPQYTGSTHGTGLLRPHLGWPPGHPGDATSAGAGPGGGRRQGGRLILLNLPGGLGVPWGPSEAGPGNWAIWPE